jgi:hypothetical protein
MGVYWKVGSFDIFKYQITSLSGEGPRQLSGTALGYGLDDRGVRITAGAGNFSPHYRVQTGSAAHPASYPMDTKGSFPGSKAAGA